MASFGAPFDSKSQQILNGFRINSMNMRDGETGRVLWESTWPDNWKTQEVVTHIPKEILKCKVVSREVSFTSQQLIEKFRLVQRIFLGDICIEEWVFYFGFVIPGSTNSWQSTIQAVEEQAMLRPEDISGLVVIETSFLNGDSLINRSLARVHYV